MKEAKPIQVLKPQICEEAIEGVVEVLKSGWIGLGPKTQEFEEEFARYVGAPHAVAVNSATSALYLALNVIGIKEGDAVISAPMTFISTNTAIKYCGGSVLFVDIKEDDLNIDPAAIEEAIGRRPDVKAIVVVHYAGKPCDMHEIVEIADRHGIWIIEDAAHACGASYHGSKIGACQYPKTLTCFSFHAVKNLPCGDGGMITTSDDEIAALLKKDRWLGIDKDTFSRTEIANGRSGDARAYAWRYAVERLGFKAHMNDITAAIGLAQLKRLDEDNAYRAEIVQQYHQDLEGMLGITRLSVGFDRVSANHLFVVKAKRRDDLILHLKDRQIHPGVHYYPNHLYPIFRGDERATWGDLPVTERVWEEIISLPLHLDLHSDDVSRIVGALAEGW